MFAFRSIIWLYLTLSHPPYFRLLLFCRFLISSYFIVTKYSPIFCFFLWFGFIYTPSKKNNKFRTTLIRKQINSDNGNDDLDRLIREKQNNMNARLWFYVFDFLIYFLVILRLVVSYIILSNKQTKNNPIFWIVSLLIFLIYFFFNFN